MNLVTTTAYQAGLRAQLCRGRRVADARLFVFGAGVPQQEFDRVITVITGRVVALTFVFGVGDVLNFALRLGVPAWGEPLVAPAVGLLIFAYGAAHVGYPLPGKRSVHQVRQRESRSARWVSSR